MSTRIVAAVCTCLLAAGCGGSGAVVVGSGQKPQPPAIDSVATVVSGSGSAPAPVISHTPAKMGVEVWLVRHGKLWPAMRGVRATRAVIGAAVKQLLAGPNAADTRARVASAVPAVDAAARDLAAPRRRHASTSPRTSRPAARAPPSGCGSPSSSTR